MQMSTYLYPCTFPWETIITCALSKIGTKSKKEGDLIYKIMFLSLGEDLSVRHKPEFNRKICDPEWESTNLKIFKNTIIKGEMDGMISVQWMTPWKKSVGRWLFSKRYLQHIYPQKVVQGSHTRGWWESSRRNRPRTRPDNYTEMPEGQDEIIVRAERHRAVLAPDAIPRTLASRISTTAPWKRNHVAIFTLPRKKQTPLKDLVRCIQPERVCVKIGAPLLTLKNPALLKSLVREMQIKRARWHHFTSFSLAKIRRWLIEVALVLPLWKTVCQYLVAWRSHLSHDTASHPVCISWRMPPREAQTHAGRCSSQHSLPWLTSSVG